MASELGKPSQSRHFIYQYESDIVEGRANGNIKWMKKDLMSIVEPMIQNVDECTILAVGSGIGAADCVFLKVLITFLEEKGLRPKIHYSVVEPDEKAIKVFQEKTCNEVKSMYKDLTFEWHVTSMQKYFKEHQHRKFNIIHFIHSLCSRGSFTKLLPSAVQNNLTDSGVIFAVLGELGDIAYKLCTKLHVNKDMWVQDDVDKHESHPHDHHEHQHQHMSGVEEFDFENIAAQHDCQLLNFLNLVDNDVTEIIKGSEDGYRKLGAMMDVKDIKASIKEADIKEMIGHIKAEAVNKVINGVVKNVIEEKNRVVVMWK